MRTDLLSSGQRVLSETAAGVQLASALSSLEAYPGAAAMLRCGSSPYDFIGLVYDDVYGHWVSPPFELASLSAAAPTTTSASYASLTAAEQQQHIWPYKAFANAGLTFQLRVTGLFRNSSGANTSYLAAVIQGVDAGGAISNVVNPEAGEVTVASSTDTGKDSGWGTPSISSSLDLMWGLIRVKVSAGTGTYTRAGIAGRWIS